MITNYEKFIIESEQSSMETPGYWEITNYKWIDGLLHCYETVIISGDYDNKYKFTKLPIKFGYADSFKCIYTNITTLDGCPKKVEGKFIVNDNELVNIKGSPKKIFGLFNCSDNKITSLVGGPEEVTNTFFAIRNKLSNLEGGPKIVGKHYACNRNQLTSLVGFPEISNGDASFFNNKLENLIGLPMVINGDLDVNVNPLTSLEGCPKIINGDFKFESEKMPIEEYPYDIIVKGKIEVSGDMYYLNEVVRNNMEIFEPLRGNKVNFHQQAMRMRPDIVKHYTTIAPPSRKSII